MNKSFFIIIILIICFISFLITNFINQIEYFLIDSGIPGSTLLLIAGTHGNEPAGTVGLEEFIKTNIKIKKGKIIVIPRVNNIGLALDLRWGFNGFFPIDYNREYPNKYSEKGGDYINRDIIEYVKISDFIVDFHEGWGFNILEPESMGSGIYPSNTELAKKIGNQILDNLNNTIIDENKKFTINFTSPRIPNTLDYYCNEINKNYILIETSGQNNIQPLEIRTNQVLLVINTLINKLGMN
jgi:hypothetical protein